MGLYLIGIGGTGAKCVEAVAHLAAAGALPAEDLTVMYVDPDEANGTLARSAATVESYVRSREAVGGGGLFATPVAMTDPPRWTPFSDQTTLTLEKMFGYNTLKAQSEGGAALFDVLYSERERKADLAVGFRGHPSIGAAVFAHTVDFSDPDGAWMGLRDAVAADAKGGRSARVVLCGSVFGGTGAAGLPNLGRMLRDDVASMSGGGGVEIACVLALPYFSFVFGDASTDVRADAGAFVPNTKAALQYYYQNGFADVFDSVYAFGEPSMPTEATASVGGTSQRNSAHPAELYGALAAYDFFSHPAGEDRPRGLYVSGRDDGALTWSDLPYRERGALGAKLMQLARFCFAYLAVYRPLLKGAQKSEYHRYPWLLDLFDSPSDVSSDQVQREADDLAAYCERALEWFAEIQSTESGANGLKLADLLDASLFAERNGRLRSPEDFLADDFGTLTDRPDTSGGGLDAVWAHVCSAPRHRGVRGLPAVARAIYEGSSDPVLYGAR